MRTLLLVTALVLFILAGLSALADGVNLNESALSAFGLAAWVGSILAPERLG